MCGGILPQIASSPIVPGNGSAWRMRKMKKMLVVCSVALFILVLGMVAHAQAPANVSGAWTVTNQGRNGVVTNTLTLTQDGGALKGSMKADNGNDVQLDSGSISGNDITFTVTRMGRNGEVKVEYKGTVDGDAMKGTFQMGQNAVDWTAKRQ
jgi:hypothetical protein